MKLNARQVDTAKPKDKPYKLADGGGLYLLVNPNGARYWRLKYRVAGKEKLLALGVYPDVTLADGGSVLLGGLISTTTTEEERGIPWLKDIPLLGQLFRVDSKSNTKSMVVMLIVPYIIENQDDAAAITEAIKRRLNIRAEDPLDTQEIQPRNPRKRFKRGSESRGIRGN